ncbi:MAG: CoA transferase [Robiginitomaculum sp.]|nr:CoA transferase [Robiginitomaculum sp.]
MQNNAVRTLKGVKIIEFSAIGPIPFCAMLLADMGADVIRIDRPGTPDTGSADIQGRGKRSIALDLKDPDDNLTAKKLMQSSDIVMEGLRPGVMERLGLGPEEVLKANQKLIYGRMTGWGQDGPLAEQAGHDINYIAITGALAAIGVGDAPPPPPLNLLGDYGGGALYLAMGLLAGLHHARSTGQGQVIDAAIVDGTLSLMTPIHWLKQSSMWVNERNNNLLDGAAHFYATYVCADGKYIAVGAIEPKFYEILCDKLELGDDLRQQQYAKEKWPIFKSVLSGIFANQPLAHWIKLFEASDACVAPVEDMISAAEHPHIKARDSMLTLDGVLQPAPAPRFSATASYIGSKPPSIDGDRKQILHDWGIH